MTLNLNVIKVSLHNSHLIFFSLRVFKHNTWQLLIIFTVCCLVLSTLLAMNYYFFKERYQITRKIGVKVIRSLQCNTKV